MSGKIQHRPAPLFNIIMKKNSLDKIHVKIISSCRKISRDSKDCKLDNLQKSIPYAIWKGKSDSSSWSRNRGKPRICQDEGKDKERSRDSSNRRVTSGISRVHRCGCLLGRCELKLVIVCLISDLPFWDCRLSAFSPSAMSRTIERIIDRQFRFLRSLSRGKIRHPTPRKG